jgi:hypothetical protein
MREFVCKEKKNYVLMRATACKHIRHQLPDFTAEEALTGPLDKKIAFCFGAPNDHRERNV